MKPYELNRQRINKRIKSAHEREFANHEAIFQSENIISVIDWQNRNGSNTYAVRYLFDGYHLYITGDLGSAILINPQKNNIDWWKNATGHLDYIWEKVLCSSEDWSFDKEIAKAEFKVYEAEVTEDDSYDGEMLDELEQAITESRTMQEWEVALAKMPAVIDYFEPQIFEEFINWGKCYPARYLLWMAGLEMALEQVSEQVNFI